jgi:hypothetical protein
MSLQDAATKTLDGPPDSQRNAHPGRQHRCCAVCTAHLHDPLPLGTVVVIERDEDLWPSKGTWRRFVGRRGTIISNTPERLDLGPENPLEQRRPKFHLEYGIAWLRKPGPKDSIDHWFLPHEVERKQQRS